MKHEKIIIASLIVFAASLTILTAMAIFGPYMTCMRAMSTAFPDARARALVCREKMKSSQYKHRRLAQAVH